MSDSSSQDEVHVGGPFGLSVAVRISGDGLDPDEISRLLGVSPKFAARKGDQIKHGRRTRIQRVSIWTYGLSEDPSTEWELDDAIVTLLERLPTDLALWRQLSERFSVDVFCGLFMRNDNEGVDVGPATLRMLADRHLTLGLDVYGPPPSDDDG